MPLRILIVGAGVAGPAFVYLLQKSSPKHTIVVVERTSSLRTAGQQIDLKAQGIPIMEKMGLLETLKQYLVPEDGMEMVDSSNKTIARFGVNSADKGQRMALTNEYEFMRGDMVKMLYEASLEQRKKIEDDGEKEGGLTYEFGKSATEFSQDEHGVDVTFSDGQKKRFDLVVAADGQGSRTRRMVFGQATNDEAFSSLGIHAAYYSIPRIEGDGTLAKMYFATKKRFIMVRTGDRPMTQIYFFSMKDPEVLKKSYKEPVEKQKEAWTDIFKDAGWQVDRLLTGLKTCDDFYAHEVAQIKMKEIQKGRVVLLGDAGYCPSPFTGMGTTASLVGAFVLAGELAKHGDDVKVALKTYEEVIRTPIDECQKMVSGTTGVMFPSSQLGIWVLKTVAWLFVSLKIDKLVGKFTPDSKDKGRWSIPDYPELNLA